MWLQSLQKFEWISQMPRNKLFQSCLNAQFLIPCCPMVSKQISTFWCNTKRLFLGSFFSLLPIFSATAWADQRISSSFNVILTYIEGSFGALLTVIFAIDFIVFSALALRQKKKLWYILSAISFLLAVGMFSLRYFISVFFATDYLS